jgi:hypothetical protein
MLALSRNATRWGFPSKSQARASRIVSEDARGLEPGKRIIADSQTDQWQTVAYRTFDGRGTMIELLIADGHSDRVRERMKGRKTSRSDMGKVSVAVVRQYKTDIEHCHSKHVCHH